MVINALLAGKGVVLFSFEMEMQEIVDILFAHRAQINRNHFNNGFFSEQDLKALPNTGKALMDFPLFVFDDPRMTPTDMEEACKRIALSHPVDLVVVDYMQLAAIENPRDNREQQVAATSRACKALAKLFKCPVLGVSQLNDEGLMRESRAISHDANCVIKLTEDAVGGIIAKVVKGRSIPKGEYYFEFQREFCIFKEIGCDERLESMIPPPPQPIPEPTLF
jgi:replicative DNA helicase